MDRMATSPADLPEFARPPVTEVVLSVMFDGVTTLGAGHVGLLWHQFRNRFPRTEDHPPVPAQKEIENEGREGRQPPGQIFQLQALSKLNVRTWFLSADGTELLQVQNDRFSRNWRRTGDEIYPRYPSVRGPFGDDLRQFSVFLSDNGLGELSPNQSEVTYVNAIDTETHGQLETVFRSWAPHRSSFLPPIEDAKFSCRFPIRTPGGEFVGRLHAEVQPAFRGSHPIFLLNLTARGAPIGPGLEGALAFLDVGHEWIVRGFVDITAERMHQAWERRR
jgi:uncharacterized protein (TIGR04255 family)